MNTIHRFNIQRLVGENKIAMSPEHKLLNVAMHPQGVPTLYAIVDPEVPKDAVVTVRGIMTGEYFDEKAENIGQFLGTVILGGGFVVHYFLVDYDVSI